MLRKLPLTISRVSYGTLLLAILTYNSETTSSILTKFSESKRSSMDNMLAKFRCLEIVAMETVTKAMFTLYRMGFCSVSKVAPVQCEQELMFCCGAEIVPKRSQCEQKPYPLCNLQRSLLI